MCLPVNCAFVSLSLSLFVVLPQLTLFVAPLDCALSLSLRADSLCSAGRALKLKRTVVDNGKCVTRNVCHLTANRMDSSAHSNSNLDANSKLELDSESESTSALDRKRGRKNERKPKTEMDFGGGSKSSVAFASFRFLCPSGALAFGSIRQSERTGKSTSRSSSTSCCRPLDAIWLASSHHRAAMIARLSRGRVQEAARSLANRLKRSRRAEAGSMRVKQSTTRQL